jgi:hypothetical protein
MSNIITAGNATNNGTSISSDTSGVLELKTGSTPTTALALDTSGNLQMNSGYGSVATAYGCRAWVNFNGTGTVAIRASGNVSSITDNGVGDYTVNFATAMPDANYAVSSAGTGAFALSASVGGWYTGVRTDGTSTPTTKTTSAVRVYSAQINGPASGYDAVDNYFSIFR